MDIRAIRRRCEARLDALSLPDPFDIAEFCAQVADRRDRRITLRAMSLAGIAYGVCLRGQNVDHIIFERDTSPFHQQHIILHELGHLICGHEATDLALVAGTGQLVEDLDIGRLQAVLQRATYSVDEEREAELLATLLEQRLGDATHHRSSPLSERLAASLDDEPLAKAATREGNR